MNWLLDDPNPAYLPLDLAHVSDRLRGLEASFAAIATARQQIDAGFTTVDTPQRRAMLANLQEQAQTTLAAYVSDVRAAFGDLLATAQANQRAAARDFAASDEGRQYLQGLAAFGTIAAHMPPDQLAAKLNSLIDSGLVGQARALAEAAALVDDGSPARAAVAMAVRRANTEALTQAEATSAAELAYLQNASDTFQVYTAAIPSRLEDAVNTGQDTYAVGNFAPAAILGTADDSAD